MNESNNTDEQCRLRTNNTPSTSTKDKEIRSYAEMILQEANALLEEEDEGDIMLTTVEDAGGETMAPLRPGGSWFKEGKRRVRSADVHKRMRFLTCMSSLGWFLWGFDNAVISPAMASFQEDIGLTDDKQQRNLIRCSGIAALTASILAGITNRWMGRRRTILLAAFAIALGSAMTASSATYDAMIRGRIVVGLGIGFICVTSPMYVAEIVEKGERGTYVAVHALFLYLGQLTAACIRHVAFNNKTAWHYMLALPILPATTIILAFYSRLPDTPPWLALTNRAEQARNVLSHYRDTDHQANEELIHIVHAAASSSSSDNETLLRVNAFFSLYRCFYNNLCCQMVQMMFYPPMRRAFVVGCAVMLVQRFSGIHAVMYCSSGVISHPLTDDTISTHYTTALASIPQILGILFGIYLIDTKGRRFLILNSLIFLSFALLGLSATFYFNSLQFKTISLFLMIFYLFWFGFGMAGLPFVICCEIYPIKVRSTAVAFTTAVYWTADVFLSDVMSSPRLVDPIGVFLFHSFVTFIGIFFLYFTLPETKGIYLEDTIDLFRGPLCSSRRNH